MIDLHSHILPGLDDGAGDMDESLAMAEFAHKDGITTMVATPHVLPGVFDNDKATILAAVDRLNEAIQERNIALSVLPGAEYYLEPEIPQKLARGELLTINDRASHLLVELPSDSVPAYTSQLLYELQLQGITPIIAHPERNLGFMKQPALLRELVSRGMLAQVTSTSITGWFGQRVKRTAISFLEQGLVQILGSDAHAAKGRAPLLSSAYKLVEKSQGKEMAEELTRENSARIIAGEQLEMPKNKPDPHQRRGWSLFSRIWQRKMINYKD